MTEAEWKKVNESLKTIFSGGAKLKIDGYEIDLHLRQMAY